MVETRGFLRPGTATLPFSIDSGRPGGCPPATNLFPIGLGGAAIREINIGGGMEGRLLELISRQASRPYRSKP